MLKRKEPSPRVLRRLIEYCPETGVLTWRERPAWMFKRNKRSGRRDHSARSWNTRHAGKTAGVPSLSSTGETFYLKLSIFGRLQYAHRIAWAIHYGEWPRAVIDHENRNGSDNRIVNLLDKSTQDNMRNASLSSANTSGVTGVTWAKNRQKWAAQIGVNKTTVALGYFDSLPDAAAARKAAEKKYGFHPNHGR